MRITKMLDRLDGEMYLEISDIYDGGRGALITILEGHTPA
jgi:hypothetical protein